MYCFDVDGVIATSPTYLWDLRKCSISWVARYAPLVSRMLHVPTAGKGSRKTTSCSDNRYQHQTVRHLIEGNI